MGLKIAGSMSVGHLAPKHTLGLDKVRQQAKNVTISLTKDNVTLRDELKGRSIEEYTNDRFQPVIDEYNARQKRKDRQIKTPYVEWHKNNGNLTQGKMSLAYECVIQIGEHESLGHQYYEATGEKREKMHKWFEKTYRQLLDDFEKKFPHLRVLYAAIHFDEIAGTPHMHLCFQPEAECTRGLGLQVSIGKALGQDGIERFENRLEAQKEGFQMGRMYREFRHQCINPIIEKCGWELKEEISGRKHDDKSYFSDMMEELDEKARQLKDAFDVREKQIAEDVARIKAADEEATKKIKNANNAMRKAKEEKFEAQYMSAQADAAVAEANREIELKQDQVKELEKKIENKASLADVNDRINEVFMEHGTGVDYPRVLKRSTKKVDGKKVEVAECPWDDIVTLKNKAQSYDTVMSKMRELEQIHRDVLKDADKDTQLQEAKEENQALRMELTKTRAERNQALERERTQTQRADRAENYIERQGMSAGY